MSRRESDAYFSVQADLSHSLIEYARVLAPAGQAMLFYSPPKSVGHWSILALSPRFRIHSGKDRICRIDHQVVEGSWWSHVEEFLDSAPKFPELPLPFYGGLAGYLSYELKNEIERFQDPPEERIPRVDLKFFGGALIEDRRNHSLWITAINASVGKSILEQLRTIHPESITPAKLPKLDLPLTFAEYRSRVQKIQNLILDGDVYEVNLTHAWTAQFPEADSLWGWFEPGLKASHSPFCGYLRWDDTEVCSLSPESFLKISGNQAEMHPIKGTRPRGRNEAEDNRIAAELLTNEKDRAENVMIVDLCRNDLGKVSVPGSVVVTELCGLHTFKHVHQLISTVCGTLREGVGVVDVLRAVFPPGSMTGAPKIRAIEIIDEIEQQPRGIYSGCLGYFSLHGSMECSVVIRTLVREGKMIFLQTGGAIVADSNPEEEWKETRIKAEEFLTL